MSVNYGAQAAGIPGNAGGVGFSLPMWTAGHLTPNVDLHNASVGTPTVLNNPSLASRTPTNPTPGPLVSQQSMFSELPTPIRNAMNELNIPNLQAQSARAALANKIVGNPMVLGGGGGGGKEFDLQDYLTKINAQRASQAAVWNAQRPDYTSMTGLPTAPAPMKPAGGDLRFPQLPKY